MSEVRLSPRSRIALAFVGFLGISLLVLLVRLAGQVLGYWGDVGAAVFFGALAIYAGVTAALIAGFVGLWKGTLPGYWTTLVTLGVSGGLLGLQLAFELLGLRSIPEREHLVLIGKKLIVLAVVSPPFMLLLSDRRAYAEEARQRTIEDARRYAPRRGVL